jgi:predicted choloylglycine hydrolase
MEASKIIKDVLSNTETNLTNSVFQQLGKFTIEFSNKFLGESSRLKQCIDGINEQELLLEKTVKIIKKFPDMIAIQNAHEHYQGTES